MTHWLANVVARGFVTKDKQSRVVPVMGGLFPVLQAWKAKSGGEGLVIPSMRVDGGHIDKKTPGNYLRAALEETGLARPGLGWLGAPPQLSRTWIRRPWRSTFSQRSPNTSPVRRPASPPTA